MRIRSIKPEFWRSSDISCLEIEDRLLFIGLWSYVDDNGVGKDKLSEIAADLFADDLERDPPETFARVSRGLARLSEAGRVVRYTVAGSDFLRIVNWSKHQRIDKPGRARYPSDDAEHAVIRESVASPPVTLAPGTGEQGNRGTVSNVQPAAGRKSDYPSEFETWWTLYPRKESKGAALKAWQKARKLVDHETLAAATQAYTLMCLGKEKQFVKLPAGWLNDRKWEDDYSSPGVRPAAPTLGAEGALCVRHAGYPLPCIRCDEEGTPF